MAEKMCAREEVFLLLILKPKDFVHHFPIKKNPKNQNKQR